jgi:nitric oxide reductase NorQ protein
MPQADATTLLDVRPRLGFMETPFVRSVTERALTYLIAGYPVHFRGPSGSGKTTLAMHVAHRLGRSIMFVCGDDEFGSSDLIGSNSGYHRRKVIDNYVHSVLKTEEDVAQRWVDNRLTMACREGLTFVYDEFTRSRPEANNVLLSVLEEKLLVFPASRYGNSYVKVHPNFTAIFTSNPDDYVAVHKTQDALRDRMVTIELDYFDRETEIAITQARSGIAEQDAERIVDLIRTYRPLAASKASPSVRSSIMIAKVLALRSARAIPGDAIFEQACLDVLASGGVDPSRSESTRSQTRELIFDLIEQCCLEDTLPEVINLPLRA